MSGHQVVSVPVLTDSGQQMHRARCQECSWRSAQYLDQAKAVAAGETHRRATAGAA